MPGPDNMDDIIDKAMANDTFDYGDTEQKPVADDIDPNAVDQPEDQAQKKTPDQQQDVRQEERVPGAVPKIPGQKDNQQQVDPAQLKRVGAQFADAKGNIVDKTGKIIARSGESARHWQEASRANAQVQNLTRQMQMQTREIESNKQIVQQAREIAELPQRMGVSREDYNEGITLMSRWRADPVGVAREIVARTLTFGHNVSDILGKSAGDALEMKAISQLVTRATAPIEQQREQSAREAEQNRIAQDAHNNFITKYPDAELHGEAIASLMKRGVNPETAYYQVKNFALENGLDFSQPLGPQIVALQRGGVQRQTVQPQQQRVPAPMANGGRGNERNPTMQPAYAEPNDDWGSIIRNAMQD